MMSKTHLTIGMATAMALATANTPAGIAAALAGGAIGGVFADVDTLKDDYKCDALIGELLALGVVAMVAALDYFLKWGICENVLENKIVAITGAVLLLVLWIFGFSRSHRQETHSLLAAILVGLAGALIHMQFGICLLIGYVSHLCIDLLNKKGILLFYPAKKELCLNLCYASKTTNTVLLILGAIATVVITIIRIFNIH